LESAQAEISKFLNQAVSNANYRYEGLSNAFITFCPITGLTEVVMLQEEGVLRWNASPLAKSLSMQLRFFLEISVNWFSATISNLNLSAIRNP
jgi:hypothetical protein